MAWLFGKKTSGAGAKVGQAKIVTPPAKIIQAAPGTTSVLKKETAERDKDRLQRNIVRLEGRLKYDRSLEGRADKRLTIELSIKQQKAKAKMLAAFLEQF